jgi:uncharacterized protein YutE (UPF0331/DUF86 family)
MIDKHLVEKKLRKIEDFMRELKDVEIETIEEFKKNIVVKRFIERNIELAIEQMVDICRHFVSGLDLAEPETYAGCFDMLAGQAVISQHNIDMFKSMVRFRNILIHAYEGVDDSITYGIYKRRLDDFKSFIKEIRDYLVKIPPQ